MTKRELIAALLTNTPDEDTEVLVSVKILNNDEAMWCSIGSVDKDGEPILIGLGEIVME